MARTSSTGKPQPTSEEIKQAVRERYAAAVTARGGSCCGPASSCGASTRKNLVELAKYSPQDLESLPSDAVENSFGIGNPLSSAGVKPGDVVLDIGSGAGIDVLLAAKVVGPSGKVIGLDMTPEMIERANENAVRAGASNVEFRLGDAEQMPLVDDSVDWIISNCVINLAPNKRRVFAEAFRVLKPGGRISISDIVTGKLPEEVRHNIALWTNCVAGAIDEEEYLQAMRDAGLVDVEVLDRQRYDADTVCSFMETNFPEAADRNVVEKVLDEDKGILDKIWSAKIVARKPA